MFSNEFHDGVQGRAWLKNRSHSEPLQFFGIRVWNRTAKNYKYVFHTALPQQIEYARHDCLVRS